MKLPQFIRKFFVQESSGNSRDVQIPDQLFVACPNCKSTLYQRKLAHCWHVCPECDHHFVLPVQRWIELLADCQSYQELNKNLKTNNPLQFPEYSKKWSQAYKKCPCESIITGKASLSGYPVLLGVMDPTFFMGSLGVVAGEKIAALFELGVEERKPVILVIRSGGARMQEGVHSLMQMAKVSVAIKKMSDAGLLYIAVLTHPTTGGVSASFAMQADITLAEPGSLIGFAGPRVIEQTIKQKLPDNFQKSEFVLEHGFIDSICHRLSLKRKMEFILQCHTAKMPHTRIQKKSTSFVKRVKQWFINK